MSEIIWAEDKTPNGYYRGILNDFKIEENKTTNQIKSKTTEIRLKHPIIDNKSHTKSLASVDDNSVTVTIKAVKTIIENGIMNGKQDIEIINTLLSYFEKDELEVSNRKLDEINELMGLVNSLNKEYNSQKLIIESDIKKLELIETKRRDILNKISTLTKGE